MFEARAGFLPVLIGLLTAEAAIVQIADYFAIRPLRWGIRPDCSDVETISNVLKTHNETAAINSSQMYIGHHQIIT